MLRSKGRVTRSKIAIEESSGNIFADIGPPNPDERLAKAALAIRITEVIRARRLTQGQTARMLETDQATISHLLLGQLSGFSAERLTHFFDLLVRHCCSKGTTVRV